MSAALASAVLAAAPAAAADGPAQVAARAGARSAIRADASSDPDSSHDAHDALSRLIDRPHTLAEIEAGVIALPTAPISKGQRAGQTPIFGRGDATVQTGLRILYRWNRDFAVGAAALFAPSPTSDNEYGGAGGLPRTHARSYLFLGGEGRYIPVHYRFLEAWVGMSVGGIIVADRYTTDTGDPVPTILGTKEVTVRTEGLAIGVQAGASYYLSESWIAGANLRTYRWILPESRRCSAIGDCATLSGTVEAFELGLTIGYRLPL